MKTDVLVILLILLLTSACTGVNHKGKAVSDDRQPDSLNDSSQIVELVKRMYKWHENNLSENNLSCLTDGNDSFYVGVDLDKQRLRSTELRNSGFFTEEFIANDYKIAETIDRNLKTGSLGDPWLVGDLPPFGSGADAWCNCQDVPNDTAWWNEIKFRFINVDSINATLIWAWVDTVFDKSKSEYTVRAVKTDGRWKVAYLEGFDFEKFIGEN